MPSGATTAGLRFLGFAGLLSIAGMSAAGAQGTATSSDKAYFDFQVERPVASDTSNKPPLYPRFLRAQHIQGEVLIQVVVDTAGRPEMSTFEVMKSTDSLFSNAVRTALADYHFSPARIGGRKVRQIIQIPFYFRLGGVDQRRTPPM